jgi:hypothetical protein
MNEQFYRISSPAAAAAVVDVSEAKGHRHVQPQLQTSLIHT